MSGTDEGFKRGFCRLPSKPSGAESHCACSYPGIPHNLGRNSPGAAPGVCPRIPHSSKQPGFKTKPSWKTAVVWGLLVFPLITDVVACSTETRYADLVLLQLEVSYSYRYALVPVLRTVLYYSCGPMIITAGTVVRLIWAVSAAWADLSWATAWATNRSMTDRQTGTAVVPRFLRRTSHFSYSFYSTVRLHLHEIHAPSLQGSAPCRVPTSGF
jgi:hypothetical protein